MIIRKLESAETKDFCCDHNDVCEGKVTHKVIDHNSTNILYYCGEHIEVVRKGVIKQ